MEKAAPEKKGRAKAAKARRWVGRRVIVDREFQLRLLKPFGVFFLLFLVLTGAFVFFPLYRHAADDPNPVVRALLLEQMLSFHIHFWPIFIISVLLACIYSLTRSRRISGPLFKLKRRLMQMMAGRYEKIRFRRNDEFREFEDVANRLALTIESLSASARRKTETIEKRLRFLKSRLEVRDLSKNEIMDELDELIGQVSQVQVVGAGADDRSGEKR